VPQNWLNSEYFVVSPQNYGARSETMTQLAAMHRYLPSTSAISRSTLCNSITPILRSGLRMRPR
jgi:hypothetical protein